MPAPLSLHLDSDGWLPVTYLDGTPAHVSLRTLFIDAHRIATLDGFTPPGQASLWRILTALTYRIAALDDAATPVDDWHTARRDHLASGQFDPARVTGYFDQWTHRFDLFDTKRPWRQEPRLTEQVATPAGLTTLIPDRPAGNAPAFFSDFHTANPGVASIAEAVDALLIRQFYGPTGRCQSRTLPGWNSGKANFTAIGPLRGRVSYHPIAPNLFATLLAHLIPPVTLPFTEPGVPDLAEWEADLPDPDQPKPSPTGIVSLLANDSGHAVLLVPGTDADGRVCVTTGYWTWRFTDKTAGNLVGWDPFLAYRTDPKAGRIARVAVPGRDMWRDLPALLADPHGTARPADKFAQPAVTVSLAGLPESLLTTVRMAAHAYYQDLAQPKDTDWSTSLIPAVFTSATAEPTDPDYAYRTAIPAWVNAAEREGQVLSQALFRALREARNLDPKGKAVTAWSTAAAPRYWAAAYATFDQALSEAVDGAAFAATVPTAEPRLRTIVRDVYGQITASVTDARGLLAVLRHQPRPHFSTPSTGTEPNSPAEDAA